MDNLIVFIDETGSFSYTHKQSAVGGWVGTAAAEKNIEDRIGAVIGAFNKTLECKGITGQKVRKHDLHFMPLHFGELRRGKDGCIRLSPKRAPELCSALFEQIRPLVKRVFRSTGRPSIIAHEQSGYVEVLRNTLVQLLEDPLFEGGRDIGLVIAHRRGMYGEAGSKDSKAYEAYIAQRLLAELQEAFGSRERRLGIEFADARRRMGLVVADLFCGAQRYTGQDYLAAYRDCKVFAFGNGYRSVGPRPLQRLRFLGDVDPVAAAIQCLDHLSSTAENPKIDQLFRKLYAGMNGPQRRQLAGAVEALLEERLVVSPDRYLHLDAAERMIESLTRALPADPSAMGPEALRLTAAIHLQRMRIASHRGRVAVNLMRPALAFLEEHGHRAFDNQLELMQAEIEIALMGVQIEAFNRMDFERGEKVIKEVRDRYFALFGATLDGGRAVDANAARLEGSLGQMYAFQADFHNDPIYFELAEDALKRDVSMCLSGSHHREQGNGFLTVLCWKAGNLDEARRRFRIEAGAADATDAAILNLADPDTFQDRGRPFVLLHRLQVCALAQRSGQMVKGLDDVQRFLFGTGDVARFPWMLCAKWAAVLLATAGRGTEALALLDAASPGGTPEDRFTIRLLRLSLKMVHHICRQRRGLRSGFRLNEEIEALEEIVGGTRDRIVRLAAGRFDGPADRWDLYAAGTLLPFNYS